MTKRPWQDLNPLYWPLMSLLVTLGCFSLGELAIRLIGWGWVTKVALPFLVSIAAAAPLVALGILAATFRRNAESLGRIVCLYIALVLLCANINFLIVLHLGQGGPPPFHGVQPVWGEAVEGRPTPFLWGGALLALLDFLHFSLSTLSSGASQIYPTTRLTRLVVDFERLTGLGITVLAVGRYFSTCGGDSSETPE